MVTSPPLKLIDWSFAASKEIVELIIHGLFICQGTAPLGNLGGGDLDVANKESALSMVGVRRGRLAGNAVDAGETPTCRTYASKISCHSPYSLRPRKDRRQKGGHHVLLLVLTVNVVMLFNSFDKSCSDIKDKSGNFIRTLRGLQNV